MKKFIVALIAVVALMGVQPVFAANLEIFDELTLGIHIKADDIILKSKNVDIGVEIGSWDVSNYDNAKNSMFALAVVTIKVGSLFDLTK